MTEWTNWSGSTTCLPSRLARPRSEKELSDLVKANGQIRMVGTGHSFTPLCATPGLMLSLSDYSGGLEIAPDRQTVWAPAGWDLDRLTSSLWAEGLSLANQGDINRQTVAGAIATGTHGTGLGLGSLSTQVRGFRLMLADGQIVECSETESPALYQSMRVSLGLFGVVVAVHIKVLPAYYLEERVICCALEEVEEKFSELLAATRHFEFFMFPYSDDVILKTLHPIEVESDFTTQKHESEKAFQAICDLAAEIPPFVPMLQTELMRLIPRETRDVGPAFQIFPSVRTVRNEEMEYEVPLPNALETLRKLAAYIRKTETPIVFPIEFRVVAGDDIWMSPFNNGPCASISLMQYSPMEWRKPFSDIEAIFRSAGGRPHWGKQHNLNAADVEQLYPRLGQFLDARREVDPGQKFANAYLASLLGLER